MAGPRYIIAHDVGTSSTKAALVEFDGKVKAYSTEPYPVHYPQVNWAEQDPDDYWQAVSKSTKKVIEEAGISPADIAGVIFTTQTVGVIPVGKEKRHLRPAVIWLDGRGSAQAEQIMNKFGGKAIFSGIAGTAITGKDGMAKLLWIQQNEPDIHAETEYYMDVNGYLILKMTGRTVYEWSTASTIGFDLKKNDWMRLIMNRIGVDVNRFPELVRSTDQVGTVSREAAAQCRLKEGTPVFGGCGDMQSAAIGAGAVADGEGHLYLGTSAWVGVTTKSAPTGREGVVALKSGDPDLNLLFGEMETAGMCLDWIKDEFYRHEQQGPGGLNIYKLMDESIKDIPAGSDYLIFTPWFYGERCPVSDVYVKSTFFNLSAAHRREHMLKSVYEGIALNLRWILEIMERRYGFSLPVLRVIGGGSNSEVWMQILADITGRRLEKVTECQMCGAVGAALIAAVGLKVYPDISTAAKNVRVEKTFSPRAENKGVYDTLYGTYKQIYRNLKKLYRQVNQEREREEANV
ncbi:MAG TPA: hypothetical protein GX744_05830 [Firmicutes bacterium]|nr:hypothetical protein [Bacillota bacterium]